MASAAYLRHIHIPVCDILVICFSAIEEVILQGQSTEAWSSYSYCILHQYIVYGQTGLVALQFRAANNFAKGTSRKGGDNEYVFQ